MRYPIDSLDMCYGIQLADSRGDIGVIYAQGLMHVLSPTKTLGSLYSYLCGLSIMNMNLFGVILVRTLGQIEWKKELCVILVRTLEQIERKEQL